MQQRGTAFCHLFFTKGWGKPIEIHILSTLNNIQSQNAQANEELGAKLMAENQKLADRLIEKLQHEISKVTEAICQLREET